MTGNPEVGCHKRRLRATSAPALKALVIPHIALNSEILLRRSSIVTCGPSVAASKSGHAMLSISKPLSAGQARTYHAREFASSEQNYWSRDQQGHSEWQGRLSGEWGLSGAVGAEHFARLSEGQHPNTQAQLVRQGRASDEGSCPAPRPDRSRSDVGCSI